jgi:hypothetical protein
LADELEKESSMIIARGPSGASQGQIPLNTRCPDRRQPARVSLLQRSARDQRFAPTSDGMRNAHPIAFLGTEPAS